ncbi:MAG: hypothetical protein JZU50_06650 [Desulfobulbaceae bacterium]|jgi:hypothetical protein|nr:hypothetical protein [Desulfobulbaceae bacterium]
MLTPREKPYLEGLNSYYLHLEKFIEHMQGEVGSGGVHCKSPNLEMLIYFNEHEIISSLLQKKGKEAKYAPSYEIARGSFYGANFLIKVYQLDAHAIFFWAQLPPFQRAKSILKSTEIPLPDLVFRLRQKQFSGFIEVQVLSKPDGGILFFHEGERVGGSYSWGKGGMSTAHEDYNTLLGRIQSAEATFTFGSFVKE